MTIVKFVGDVSDVNNNNLTEYSPYLVVDNVVHVDRKWFARLPSHIQRALEGDIIFEDIVIPHASYKLVGLVAEIYTAYVRGFDYQHFAYAKPDAVLYQLSLSEKRALRSCSISGNRGGDKISPDLDDLRAFLHHHISADTPKMLRMSSTSGKHSQAVHPMTCAGDAIDALVTNPQFLRNEFSIDLYDSFVVLVSWNDKIDRRCEFRLFIYNHKLVAASQQYFLDHTLPRLSPNEISIAVDALEKFDPQIVHTFTDYVADVYVDFDDGVCHLIECNPFGAFGSSGAALFNWELDHDLLHGRADDVELRII